MKATDIRIEDVTYSYEDFHYRTPIKFGGVALDRATVLNAHVTVRTVAGKTARGFGSMPMGNVWSFPSKTFTYDQTLNAMKSVVEQIATITRDCKESGHPIDLTCAMEHQYVKAASEIPLPSPLRGRGAGGERAAASDASPPPPPRPSPQPVAG